MSGALFGGGAVASTVSVSTDECFRPPSFPVNVTVAVVAAALDEAANVTLCELPTATLNEAGVAVTPTGSPLLETGTVLLKAFTGCTDTLTCDPVPPAWIVTVVGDSLSTKSGKAGGLTDPASPPHDSSRPATAKHIAGVTARKTGKRIRVRYLFLETIDKRIISPIGHSRSS